MRALFAIALGMGTLLPTAVRADTVWLYLTHMSNGMALIPMNDMTQCEVAAAKYMTTDKVSRGNGKITRGYECFKGK